MTLRNAGLACVLSLIVPGVGQFYNGDFLRGLFWLIVTPGFWIGIGRHARLDLPRPRGDHRLPPRGLQEPRGVPQQLTDSLTIFRAGHPGRVVAAAREIG